MYLWFYKVNKLTRKELKTGKKIGITNKLTSWRKGFFSSSFVLYELNKNNADEYLSDYDENIKAIDLNNEYYELLDDKIRFVELIKQWVDTPNDLAKIIKGYIKPLNGNNPDLLKYLTTGRALILKPLFSASGIGVVKVSYEEGVIFNKDKISESEFLQRLHNYDNYLVSDYIKQAEYSDKIYSKTANTIRILTMVDPNNGKSFIAAAAHRFGTDNSFPVDNCNAGGLTSNIDVETGELSAAVTTYFSGNELKKFTVHPDTKSQISGVKIPMWNLIRDKILLVSEKISFLKYIGWDVIPTNEGFVVLEGNNGPDIKLHQVHSPLLRNPSVKKFFQYYKVV